MRRKAIFIAIVLAAAVAIIVGTTTALVSGGNGKAEAAATPATTSNSFQDEPAFEQEVKDGWLRMLRDQSGLSATITKTNCIKTSPTTALCQIIADVADMRDANYKIAVTCQDSDGNNCYLEWELLNYQ